MRHRHFTRIAAAASVVALLASGPASANLLDGMQLICDGPFARDANKASLVKEFGKKYVRDETFDGPEGSTFQATVVHPDDPAERLVVIWWDEAEKANPSTIIIEKDSTWKAPGGVRLGATVEDITDLNGAPFEISGFGWDYGGSAGFTEGRLAEAPNCSIGLTFDLGEQALGPEFDAIMGDRQISSEDPLIRQAAPTVTRISLGYPAE